MRNRFVLAALVITLPTSGFDPAPGGAGQGTPVKTPVNGSISQLIVYQWEGRIRTVRRDGAGEHIVTPDWAGGDQYHPDLSPDALLMALRWTPPQAIRSG